MSFWFFFCRNKRTTFPQTRKRRTYVACLDCGKEFNYDWRTMERGEEIEETR